MDQGQTVVKADVRMKCFSINGFAGDRTPYGMAECHALAKTISHHFGLECETHGEAFPVANLNWDQALIQSQPLFDRAATVLKEALAQDIVPLVVTPRCATSIATLPQVAVAHPDCVLVYLDAHGDLTTPDTSESGYLGGMPISAAMGLWQSGYGAGFAEKQIVHIGGRDFDKCEQDLLEQSEILVLPKQAIEADLSDFKRRVQGKPVYVHIDVDVFDPSEVVAEYAVEDGLSRHHVNAVLHLLNEQGRLVGLEIAEFSPKNKAERAQSYSALLEGLTGLKSLGST